MKNEVYGKKRWAFSGGYIPLDSTGNEPEYISKDTITIMNTTKRDAQVNFTLYFTDRAPVGIYKIEVKAERVRRFHVNDLIDPQAVPLGVAYGGTIVSNEPVVVQLTKQHTGQSALALTSMAAYPAEQDTN